jgi:DNA-binding transcriptional LysR family regulator
VDAQSFTRVSHERAFYLSSHHTKKEALVMGVGFGWMPLYLVHKELRAGLLRELK